MSLRSFFTHGVLLAIIALLAVALFHSQTERRRALTETEKVRKALSGELEASRDKLGRETAKTEALEASRANFLGIISEQGSKIEQLQQVVRKAGKHTSTAMVVSTETVVATGAKSEVTEIPGETDSCPDIAYSAFVGDDWIEGYITADRDSVKLNYLKIRNEFEIWQREERAGFLKPRRPVVYFRSLNPYTSVTDLQSFTVSKKKPTVIGQVLKTAIIALAVKGGVDLVTR